MTEPLDPEPEEPRLTSLEALEFSELWTRLSLQGPEDLPEVTGPYPAPRDYLQALRRRSGQA